MEYLDFKEILEHINTLSWKDDYNIDNKVVFDIAANNFSKITQNSTKNLKYIRVAGQSGSGKTTQLLPAAQKYFEAKQIRPINFAVRDFAHLHPNYNEIIQQFGASQMREKTNSFALRCMLISLIIAINNGYDILLDITMLTPEFEEFINKNLAKNNYENLFLVLAVNKEISNYFIEKRKNSAGKDAGRVVYKSSADFFYDALIKAMEYYSKHCENEHVIIWNAFLPEPIYDGRFKNALRPFKEAQNNISHNFNDENLMRNAKIEYLLNLT